MRHHFIEYLIRLALHVCKTSGWEVPPIVAQIFKMFVKISVAEYKTKNDFFSQAQPYQWQRVDEIWLENIECELVYNDEQLRKVFAEYSSKYGRDSKDPLGDSIEIYDWQRLVREADFQISDKERTMAFALSKKTVVNESDPAAEV